MIFRKTLVLFLVLFTCLMISHNKLLAESQFNGALMVAESQPATPEITGINVEKVGDLTEIRIESSDPSFSYTIYNPEDPYKVVVELQGVEPGTLKDKMVVDKAGVMEILVSKIEGAVKIVRLDITLAVPANIKPVQKGKVLVLAFHSPKAEEVVKAPEKERPVAGAEKEPETSAEKEPAVAKAAVIENIELVKPNDNKVEVLIHGDGRMSPKVFEIEGNKLVIDIPDVTTKIDSYKAYEPPVSGVRVGKYPNKTRIVFDLMESTKYDVSTEGKQIRVSFEKPGANAAKAETLVPEKAPQEVPKETAAPAAVAFTTKEYTGEKISLDFQDADLIHIFRLIADVSGYNIVVSPQVKGKFSMKLLNVPWDQALDIILRNYGLSKSIEGNIIRIAPTAIIAQEEEEIAKAKEAALRSGDLETRVYKINYADVKKVQDAIKDAKTERGKINVDERTSTVIIKDVANKHKEFEQLIKSIDLPTQQVNIEAKIVEVTTNFAKELGIQWGILWRPHGGRATIGGPSIPGGTGFDSGNPLMVNLPAAVGAGTGGAIGIGYISGANSFTLDLQLSAAESAGKGKIISNPRITTLDNQEAKIQQGKKISFQTFSANEGTKTEFIDANLELTVTPHITPEGTIVMKLDAKKDEPDFSRGVDKPDISINEAKTQVLIKDGDTLVIGGVFKSNTSKKQDGIPGVSKIPVLGWLFKKDKNTDDTSELLIFITPRVVKQM